MTMSDLSPAPIAPVEPDQDEAPGSLPSYQPIPYRVDLDEAVTCPHCQLKNDADASFCDQCGIELVGRLDVQPAVLPPNIVTDEGEGTDSDPAEPEPYQPEPYDPQADETVQCPNCEKMNDLDARFCDQCGIGLVGRPDVKVDGPAEEVDNVQRSTRSTSSSTSPAPRENLVRARFGPATIELRDIGDGSNGSMMFGHFSAFNEWYEIDSYWEGTFLESVAPGAYAQTMVDDIAGMRVLYDHGFDPSLGNKPLGPITTLREDDIGAYYEVPLLDTDYNRNFTLPVLQGRLMSGEQVGSQLGASMRFIVLAETWTQKPDPSEYNQLGLPERVITQAQVLEFGPVTFPANASASAGVRSLSDTFIDRLHHDPRFLARFTDRVGVGVVERMLEAMPAADRAGQPRNAQLAESSPDRQSKRNQLRRRAQAALVL